MPKAARERSANPRAGAAPCSTLRIASGMRPSNEQGGRLVTQSETNVNDNIIFGDKGCVLKIGIKPTILPTSRVGHFVVDPLPPDRVA